GGGGRIALYFLTSTLPASNVTANSGSSGTPGMPGTIFSGNASNLVVVPNHGGNAGSTSVRIYGQGLTAGRSFVSGATVKLVCLGQPEIMGDNVIVAGDGSSISTRFNLRGRTAGTCDITVTNPDGSSITRPGAFSVADGGSARIWTDLYIRSTI